MKMLQAERVFSSAFRLRQGASKGRQSQRARVHTMAELGEAPGGAAWSIQDLYTELEELVT